MAQIDDYIFEINKTSFDKLQKKITFSFVQQKRLGNFDSFQSVGMYEESISIDGTLITKSQTQLKEFEDMAKKKLPVTMAFTNGTCITIIITDLETEQSKFLVDGSFLRQTYKISIGVINEND